MSRRIKLFGGQEMTLPVKEPKLMDRIFTYLIYQKEHAETEIKKYQAYRNYMLFLIGFNTAFRAEDLLQLRVKDVYKGYVSIKNYDHDPESDNLIGIEFETVPVHIKFVKEDWDMYVQVLDNDGNEVNYGDFITGEITIASYVQPQE